MKTRAFAWTLIIALAASLALVLGLSISNTPTPAPVATAPAPLPPGTGVDGGGAGDEVVEPDAGAAANVEVEPGPSDGVGGEVYVESPAYEGRQRLNAGYYYPSGTFHGAWDVGLWTGTKLFAAFDGVVVGTNDGVRNNPPGVNPGGGAPSNWVLLCRVMPKGVAYAGQPVVLYYQHMSPGVRVKPGQPVKRGTWLGTSGNTGNSTGPHLHLSASTSPYGCGMSQAQASSIRYRYLTSDSARLFAPSKAWAQPPRPAINAAAVIRKCRVNGRAPGVRHVRKALGMTPRPRCNGPVRQQMRRWQRLNKQPRTGILSKPQLRKLGRQTKVYRVR